MIWYFDILFYLGFKMIKDLIGNKIVLKVGEGDRIELDDNIYRK